MCVTSMASKPQYSRASSSRGTSACSKRVVPHVFKMKRLLETNMLLSLKDRETFQIRMLRFIYDLTVRHGGTNIQYFLHYISGDTFAFVHIDILSAVI